jgi:spermidine/putrescine transport system ATP-binding protein
MSSTAIDIDDLRKEFGDIMAVNDVSFSVRQGEFFTLVGPSGSGKTTLLRLLAGLEAETSGAVYIDETEMADVPPESRPTNMVFQDLALFPFKNVYENLTFGLKMDGVGKKERRERADDMLSTLDLDGYGKKKVDELSGGEQQRIALGRSLLAEPDVLLLDEPLSSLDVKLRKEMQLELRRIHDDLESTFFYVTHDQDVALTASDRIGVMNDGEIIQIGTPKQVYEKPATPFVAEFIGDTNLWRATVVDAAAGVVKTQSGQTLTVERDGLSDGEPVSVSIRPEQIKIADSLNDSNVLTATVSDQIYQGNDIIYEVETETGEVTIRQSAEEGTGLFDTGAVVEIGFNPSSIHLIPEDSA